MEEIRNIYRNLAPDFEGKDYLGDTDADKRIILKCVLDKADMNVWTG
jgi:hypothetical protein